MPPSTRKGKSPATIKESSTTPEKEKSNKVDFDHFSVILKVAVAITLICGIEFFVPTAYGKHSADDSSPEFIKKLYSITVSGKMGWFLMELPNTFMIAYVFWYKGYYLGKGPVARNPMNTYLAILFSYHYLYRGWIFPLCLAENANSKGFSLFVALGSWLVTIMHGYLTASYLATYSINTRLSSGSFSKTFTFKLGLFLYYGGYVLINYHDHLQRSWRSTTTNQYVIPNGGLWDYSASAHYFCELIMWFGFFTLHDFGPNGAFIFLVSCMNLIPRAFTNYRWYEAKFGPEFTNKNMAKLIPFVM